MANYLFSTSIERPGTECDLAEFEALLELEPSQDDYPLACEIIKRVPVYESQAFELDPSQRVPLLEELASVLLTGPGVFMVRSAMTSAVVDEASTVFYALLEAEAEAGTSAGDHFAEPGANQRLWNALEKFALRSPEAFVEYYANRVIAWTAEAWLGPNYQITSQINVVNPGGRPQAPHRDYHLGFMTQTESGSYPAHVHGLSPLLTLQGAVAHCDMSVESGPTMVLPFSQRFLAGYQAWRLPDFIEVFENHKVQLPLAKGDMLFFNPAIFHGAGGNVTENVSRMANLLQVSSAFGRAMEAVDRQKMLKAIYPFLVERFKSQGASVELDAAIVASAEGYSFPNDLDLNQPVDGLTPLNDATAVRIGLSEGLELAELSIRWRDSARV